MEFLKELALPHSLKHFAVLYFIYALASAFFLAYAGILLGGTLLSLWHLHRGCKPGEAHSTRFAKDLIDIAIVNRGAPLVFGVIPLLSLLLIYTQLLSGTGSSAVGWIALALILFAAASYLLYTYKYVFALGLILDSVDTVMQRGAQGVPAAAVIQAFLSSNRKSIYRRGWAGAALLVCSVYCFDAGSSLVLDPQTWDSGGGLGAAFISPLVWLRFLSFLLISLSAAGAIAAYLLFVWQGGRHAADGEYAVYVRRNTLPWSLLFLLALPILLAIDVMLLPRTSLSAGVFGALALGLTLIFFVAHFLYGMIRRSNFSYAASAFYFFLGLFVVLALRETALIAGATRPHSVFLAGEYVKAEEALKKKLGRGQPALSAEDIFTGRCAACHAYDRQVVGPAYKDVLPKYEEKRGALVKFILNPQKVDPAFPPMPAQGLKPAEAAAVADYIVKEFRGGK